VVLSNLTTRFFALEEETSLNRLLGAAARLVAEVGLFRPLEQTSAR